MTIAIDVAAEGVRVPNSAATIAGIARAVLKSEKVKDAMISIAFVDERAIAKINRKHLGHSGPTDVISFGFARRKDGPVVGDIYICPEVARLNAIEHGVNVRQELARLVVHGTLHVLGYDHPEDEEERLESPMWRRQEQLLRRILKPKS